MLRFLTISLMFSIIACNNSNKGYNKPYFGEIEMYRNTKDSMFRIGKQSPFYKRKNFNKLQYFDVNINLKVYAQVSEDPNPEIVQMKTTTERLPVYLKKYRFDFMLDGDSFTLWGFYKNDNPGSVFLPFKDLTNGIETYGGGRFLDLILPFENGNAVLDFNLAYNPYCHYDTGYSCPIVPFYNHLKTEIRAGEKLYKF